jgi:hypothetical protein
VDASGNLGLASSTLWGRLSVEMNQNPSGVAPAFVVSSYGTSTPSLIVDGNVGYVGIGTANPAYQLHLYKGSENIEARIETDSSGAAILTLEGNRVVNLGIGSLNFLNSGDDVAAILAVRASANDAAELRFSTQATGGSLATRMTIGSGGTVTMPNLGTTGQNTNICAIAATGELIESATTDCSVSSVRFKENITGLEYSLSDVLALRPVSFVYKPELEIGTGTKIGFIAEDMKLVIPEVVHYDEEGLPYSIDYSYLIPVLAKGMQDLVSIVDVRSATTSTSTILSLFNSTTSPAIVIDEEGNVGIGTSMPEYKLQVAGEVAANAFINISASSTKRDIRYLDEGDKQYILEELRRVNVAEYRYDYEEENEPLHFELIAEELPSEVLSVSGSGVNLYKLSTFTLVGVQELAKKLDGIEERLAALEANASSTPQASSASVQSVLDYLAELGVRIVDGITRIANLVADHLTVGSAGKPTGITLYDENTGEPYCFKIRDGAPTATAGECSKTANNPPAGAPAGGGGDTIPPVITIYGNNPAYAEVGANYADLGAAVTDDVDENLGLYAKVDGTEVGDIGNITIDTSVDGEHEITFYATDNAGNYAETTRLVIVGEGNGAVTDNQQQTTDNQTASTTEPVLEPEPEPADTTPPLITLIGESSVEVEVGGSYVDAGATAFDDIDGDLSSQVVTGGLVDTAAAGTYSMTFNVSDRAGNSADEVVRTVTVVELAPVVEEVTPAKEVTIENPADGV